MGVREGGEWADGPRPRPWVGRDESERGVRSFVADVGTLPISGVGVGGRCGWNSTRAPRREGRARGMSHWGRSRDYLQSYRVTHPSGLEVTRFSGRGFVGSWKSVPFRNLVQGFLGEE